MKTCFEPKSPMSIHIQKIAQELSLAITNVKATLELLDEGATVPFISRYRKERTGSLDEVEITKIRDLAQKLRDTDKRREAILKSIKEQEKLTPSLEKKINAAETITELEDLYLPYKPKRRTKATIAKEKGLEPLAKVLFEQSNIDIEAEALKYVDQSKEVNSAEEALQGARHIIAEIVNEDKHVREVTRNLFSEKAVISTKVLRGKEKEAEKYKDYFEWDENLKKAPSHRVLAMRRGEKELFLMMDISPEKEEAIHLIEKQVIKENNETSNQVKLAIDDSYKRLIKPSIETEFRLSSKKKADQEAITVFAENLRELLLASPLGQKAILAVDPGFRTGCKVAALDKQGKLLDHLAIFPNEPQKKVAESGAMVKHLIDTHGIEAIAVGNGTASRETESFLRDLKLPSEIQIISVNESGASIYSASEVAREEFPDHDVTVRGAVSIGRRLADPLAELVKLDPKSIGVGQYQHDVDQNGLKTSLDEVVSSCVNAVGVEMNTASKQLLTYVSGLGPQLAENIIAYRNENGPFKTRKELKKVARMGEKAFEQAAGFLRIRGAKNPLDHSAVHPESYHIVEKMAKDLGCSVQELITDASKRSQIKVEKYVSDEVGLPTLKDIVNELEKPGRDPRKSFEAFQFMEGVNEISDLREGMRLPGIVTNVTKFGAFVDVGVHQDGLVHISALSNTFVSDPSQIVKVQQKVMVTVLEVDVDRKRISLSMKEEQKNNSRSKSKSFSKRPQKKEEHQDDFQAKLGKLKGLWS